MLIEQTGWCETQAELRCPCFKRIVTRGGNLCCVFPKLGPLVRLGLGVGGFVGGLLLLFLGQDRLWSSMGLAIHPAVLIKE